MAETKSVSFEKRLGPSPLRLHSELCSNGVGLFYRLQSDVRLSAITSNNVPMGICHPFLWCATPIKAHEDIFLFVNMVRIQLHLLLDPRENWFCHGFSARVNEELQRGFDNQELLEIFTHFLFVVPLGFTRKSVKGGVKLDHSGGGKVDHC